MFRYVFAGAALMAASAQAEIESGYHQYTVGDRTYEGYVATNTAITPKGTVLIVHDWDGMTAYEERRAEMLAALGYTAFAIDVYGADENPTTVDENRALSGALYSDRAAFRERLMGSIMEAANIPGASDAMVMMGYCFGGPPCWRPRGRVPIWRVSSAFTAAWAHPR